MCCANVEIEKVCYSPIAHTIDDIAQRSANDRAVGKCFGRIFDAKQHDSKPNTDGKSESGEAPPRRAAQHPESHAVITRKDEVESRKHGNPGAKSGGIRNDNGFGDLIDCERSKRGKDADHFG